MRAGLLIAIAAGLALAAPVSAAPNGRIAARCSASGDSCYAIFKDRGDVIRFQLTLAARYYNRYRICVKPPPGGPPGSGATACKNFPVKRTVSLYGGAVIWERNFPRSLAQGRYRVTWTPGVQAVGPGVSLFFVAPQKL